MGIEACARFIASAQGLHAALGGSRIQRIDLVLADGRKLDFGETLVAVLSSREPHEEHGLADVREVARRAVRRTLRRASTRRAATDPSAEER